MFEEEPESAAGAVLFLSTGPCCAISGLVTDPTRLIETTDAATHNTSARLLRKFAKIAIDDIDEHTAEQLLAA